MDKAVVRKEKLQWRNQLPKEIVEKYSHSVIRNILNFFAIEHSHCIHLFLPIENKNELNTWLLLKKLTDIVPVHQCYTSYIDYSAQVLYHTQLYEGIIWKKDTYNIPVPELLKPVSKPILDFIFVPLLAFNNENHRIGYGKGYYDNFLKDYPKCTTIGLAFEGQKADFKAEKHDIRLKYIVTEKCIYYKC